MCGGRCLEEPCSLRPGIDHEILLPLLREVREMGYGSAEFRQRLEDAIGRV